MRIVKVPTGVVQSAAHGPIRGICIQMAVCVDWPELRLTESQVIANSIARVYGYELPYPDHSIFAIEVPYIESAVLGSEK